MVNNTTSRRPILVIGNSHTTAIAAALQATPDERFDLVNLASYFDPVNRRNKVLPPTIVELFQPRQIFATFGGSEHSVLGLLEAPVKFDFMTPADSGLEPGRERINFALLRATLAQAMQNGLNHLRHLRKLYDCPITHLCTPAPFRDLDPDHVLPRVFQENLHLGVSPASVRRKLHWTHSEIARETCREIGVDFMEVPPESLDADGYLLARYRSKDPTHGNHRYGALMIKHMLELADA